MATRKGHAILSVVTWFPWMLWPIPRTLHSAATPARGHIHTAGEVAKLGLGSRSLCHGVCPLCSDRAKEEHDLYDLALNLGSASTAS